jgi:hypothetical protein
VELADGNSDLHACLSLCLTVWLRLLQPFAFNPVAYAERAMGTDLDLTLAGSASTH